MSNQFVEALKEFLRVVLVAVIPVVIDALQAGAIDLKVVGVAAAIALLRAIDKYLHKSEWTTPLDLGGLDGLKE